ncbi:MAG: hypothetical protein KAW17_01825 [Candidatus Eisenbacteria sp.]|nr:hypothetical protein [Candidatus Eisenbacteria bacterium]
MAIMLKRQISDDEKAEILKMHGRKCFATGHTIPEGDPVHFDHIRAFGTAGLTEIQNIAPMCEQHNLQKGQLPLEDFRVKLRLQEFFTGGDSQTLRHMLEYLQLAGELDEFGQSVSATENADTIVIESAHWTREYTLYECATTGWKYFYATLPVQLLDSDDEKDPNMGLQPRYLIFDKVFKMYRHFQMHPVLQPSIGRIVGSQIRLFDGQHKIAALLWTGRREFKCKIYLAPELRLLNQTNIAAHDKFAQTRFYSSIMVMKLGSQFGADFEEYKSLEDGEPKSEAGLMAFLDRKDNQSLTKAERNRQFRSYLYNSVLDAPDNKCRQLLSASNRSTDERPLTIDMLSKSVFQSFLYRHPVEEDMATDAYRRQSEIENTVALMNMLHDHALGSWDAKASPADSNQRRLSRMFRSKSIMAWSELLRDAVCGKLDLQDTEDRARPFYRDLRPEQLEQISAVVERLAKWKFWRAPAKDEIDRILADNKSAVKDWLKKHGLTTGYLMGAPE